MAGYFTPITAEDRAFTNDMLRKAGQAKGSPLTVQERREVLERANIQLKHRNISAMCRTEGAQAGTDDSVFSWQPRRPFRR